MYLYIDGARMSHALASDSNDIQYEDLTSLCDIFILGGTKNGLIGEAIVVVNEELKKNFINLIKQKGGLMAKGFVLGIIFDESFKSKKYFENAKISYEKARELAKGIKEIGIDFHQDFESNQIFILLDQDKTEKLSENVSFEIFGKDGEMNIVRLVTTYRTSDDEIKELVKDLGKIYGE